MISTTVSKSAVDASVGMLRRSKSIGVRTGGALSVLCEVVFNTVIGISFYFFFSSRRRHTRCSRDWSSDVCSSDLGSPYPSAGAVHRGAWRSAADLQMGETIDRGEWPMRRGGVQRREFLSGAKSGDRKSVV